MRAFGWLAKFVAVLSTTSGRSRQGQIQGIQATLSCPSFSSNMHQDATEAKELPQGMPAPVPGCRGVHHCADNSFGPISYLITRPEGNILMDSPRFNAVLKRKFEELGGIKYIVLSHIDVVGDQDKWAESFGATRIMHETEIQPSISDIEIQLQGEGPWNLAGKKVDQSNLDGGVQIVHVPGHTAGSVALWHAPTKAVFTGDHLGWYEQVNRVSIFERYNRAGVQMQLESVKKLLDYDFMHVLPGHGKRFSVKDSTERLKMVNALVEIHSA